LTIRPAFIAKDSGSIQSPVEDGPVHNSRIALNSSSASCLNAPVCALDGATSVCGFLRSAWRCCSAAAWRGT
jgi:hypothetical protein